MLKNDEAIRARLEETRYKWEATGRVTPEGISAVITDLQDLLSDKAALVELSREADSLMSTSPRTSEDEYIHKANIEIWLEKAGALIGE